MLKFATYMRLILSILFLILQLLIKVNVREDINWEKRG
jgi:hypothetical protein